MKQTHALALGALLLASVSFIARAAGPLAPPGAPGAPAADMPSLKEVQDSARACRTEICTPNSTYTITKPGSYVLCCDLTVASGNGIVIDLNSQPAGKRRGNVTIDLNGFTISSTNVAGTGSAITVVGAGGGYENITIRNGHISGEMQLDPQATGGSPVIGPGFEHGINMRVDGSNWADNVDISNVNVYGVRGHGIWCGEQVSGARQSPINAVSVSSNVRACTVRMCGGAGIVATNVNGCVAAQIVSDGIVAKSVSDCNASSIKDDGIVAYTATNCYGTSGDASLNNLLGNGTGRGVAGQQAANCLGSSVSGYGLEATNAENCRGTSKFKSGLKSTLARGCIGTNTNGGGNGVECTGLADACMGSAGAGFAGVGAAKATNCLSPAGGGGVVSTIAGASSNNTPP